MGWRKEILARTQLEGGVIALDAEWKPFQSGLRERLVDDKLDVKASRRWSDIECNLLDNNYWQDRTT